MRVLSNGLYGTNFFGIFFFLIFVKESLLMGLTVLPLVEGADTLLEQIINKNIQISLARQNLVHHSFQFVVYSQYPSILSITVIIQILFRCITDVWSQFHCKFHSAIGIHHSTDPYKIILHFYFPTKHS